MSGRLRGRYIRTGCALVGLLALGGALQWVRLAAGGFHNAFSVTYWVDRSKGLDLYNPASMFLKRGNRANHDVLLTFDDGPHPISVGRILATLKQEQVPAVFFVVGEKVRQDPAVLRQMIANGDEIGDHTETHLRLDTLTNAQIRAEIEDCEHDIEKATGRRSTVLRPPGMRFNQNVLAITKSLGYTIIGWNVAAKDFIPVHKLSDMSRSKWNQLPHSPQDVVDRVMEHLQNGVIVLLHDSPATADALPEILKEMKQQNYQFRTVEQFMAELPHPVSIVVNPPVMAPAPTVPTEWHGILSTKSAR